jgi:hypothetical protein
LKSFDTIPAIFNRATRPAVGGFSSTALFYFPSIFTLETGFYFSDLYERGLPVACELVALVTVEDAGCFQFLFELCTGTVKPDFGRLKA